MNTLNKLPHVKPDLVRVDGSWEEWEMGALINNLQAWLKRNKCDDGFKPPSDNRKRERYWYGGYGKPKPKCIFCSEEHWSDECKRAVTRDQRKKFFVDKNLCFNCGRTGHRGSQCRSRGCFKCGSNIESITPVYVTRNKIQNWRRGVYSMVTVGPLRRIRYQQLFQSRFGGR